MTTDQIKRLIEKGILRQGDVALAMGLTKQCLAERIRHNAGFRDYEIIGLYHRLHELKEQIEKELKNDQN